MRIPSLPLAALWPPVPEEVRDELALMRYERVRKLVPLLYLTVIAVVLTSMMAATHDAPFLLSVALPGAIMALCAVRLLWWLRRRDDLVDAASARKRVSTTTSVAIGICALASLWATFSWVIAEPGGRTYYILFMSMGALASSFCLSSIRTATLGLLVVGYVPTLSAMLVLGDRLDLIGVWVISLAGCFLIRMVHDQHNQIVDSLLLRLRLQEEARRDPLTGLANRRALTEAMAMAVGADSAVAIIDLDGFKPVNDGHGHAAGDRMLTEVARRMQGAVEAGGLVARLGGDEFALFVADSSVPIETLVDRMLAALARPIDIGRQRIAIGASAGIARAGGKARDADSLLAEADARLYKAKAMRAGGAGTRHRPVSRSGTRG